MSTHASPVTRERLATGDGQISVAESVVQKIAGTAWQRSVKLAVERMTGLRVVEVNIAVDDVCLPTDGDDGGQDTPSRVS